MEVHPRLDERLLLLAREAAEAVEALALAVAVVEAAVRALGKLRERAQGGVRAADHLTDGVRAARDAGVGGERASGRAGRGVHLEEELHTGLARLVREGDVEVDLGAIGGDGAGGLALVGRAVAVGRRDVLLAVHEAVAHGGSRRARASGDALEHLVGERAERVLHVRGHDGVVRRGGDAVRAPHTSVRVVVNQREGAGLRVDLDGLHAHGRLDRGERVVALGRNAGGAVRAGVAEVALAALDLLGVPQLVEEAVVVARVVRVRDGVRDGLRVAGRVDLVAALRRAGARDHASARAGAAIVEVAGELVDVLARAVAGAALRAGGAAAALALIAVEALALARLAVAHALVRALGVVVRRVGAVRRVRPGERVRARAAGAVRALPVLEARALVVGTAHTVAGAAVGARRGREADQREEHEGLHG